MKDPKGWHSRGYLPHFDSPERIQHVVFRTYGSLKPAAGPLTLAESEAALNASTNGRILADPQLAAIVEAAILHFDGDRYRIIAWCVMPNHAHVVVEQVGGHALGAVVGAWKGHTSRLINRALCGSGPVWAKDYYDRYMRDAEQTDRVVDYVENNPVSAGLVMKADEWPFSSARRR